MVQTGAEFQNSQRLERDSDVLRQQNPYYSRTLDCSARFSLDRVWPSTEYLKGLAPLGPENWLLPNADCFSSFYVLRIDPAYSFAAAERAELVSSSLEKTFRLVMPPLRYRNLSNARRSG